MVKNRDIHKIDNGLYLSNEYTALNKAIINKYNIGYIVNATNDAPCKFRKEGVEYFRVAVEDSLEKKDIILMSKYIPAAVTAMLIAKGRGLNILVHCHQGIQRSAIIIAAFLFVTNKDIYKNQCVKKVETLFPLSGSTMEDSCIDASKVLDLISKYIISIRGQAFHEGDNINFDESFIKFVEKYKVFIHL